MMLRFNIKLSILKCYVTIYFTYINIAQQNDKQEKTLTDHTKSISELEDKMS